MGEKNITNIRSDRLNDAVNYFKLALELKPELVEVHGILIHNGFTIGLFNKLTV